MPSLVFLLGAGISLADGKPTVGEITRELAEARDIPIDTQQLYRFDAGFHRLPFQRMADAEIKIVEHAFALAEESLLRAGIGRGVTYEEVAAVIGALADHLTRERENAIIEPWVERLCATLPTTRRDLSEAAHGARDLITDLVVFLLSDGPTPPRLVQFGAVTDAARELGRVCVATLNHDLLAEAAFAAAGVEISDGFANEDARGVATWEDDFPAARPRLLKLHGSVDWWRMPHPEKTLGLVPARVRPGAGSPWDVDVRPVLLTGTHQKEFEYSRAVLLDQQFRFAESLRDTHLLITIGYGFGDKAVNSRIIDWMTRHSHNRLTVVGPHLETLHEWARRAIGNQVPGWRRDGRLSEVDALAEDTTWSQVRLAARI